ncbi:MAG: hypothetical protein JXB44_11810 [Calditrichaceae bacterium]|nr:hypothetical protein [Calditrichaceae bacterium]
MEGIVRTKDPFRWRLIFGAVAAFILLGALTGILQMSFQHSGLTPDRYPSNLIYILMGGFIGIVLSFAWIRRSKFGIDRDLLANHARWLVSGETVIILQGSIETLRLPFTILIESGDTPPAVFVLHPRRVGPIGEDWSSDGASFNLVQFQDHARYLATEHQLDPKPIRNTNLLKRLEQGRRWVQDICLDLSEASRLQQSIPPTTDWLLDNEYILESNANDVRLNLPRQFYRQLPALASEKDYGLPRIYGLARELAAHADLSLDQENILAFIEAYQSVEPLSIGELWAVPQILRTALIEGIQKLAGRALSDLREGEIANFWANRLITVDRRYPHQLFSIMAEMTETQPNPSSYFAAQLIDYLYDDRTALAPVQSWLENIFHKSLNELRLREKNRQAKDQISIGNAFFSLRQLALIDW